MFRVRGYDAVSVADATTVLLIKPPSFYIASGNKISLHKRVLDHYVQTEAILFDDTLHLGRPIFTCFTDLPEEMARYYATDPHTSGRLVLEDTHGNDPQVQEVARNFYSAAEHKTHDFIAQRYPKETDSLTNYVSTTTLGLPEEARCGHLFERLLASVRIASVAVWYQLSR